MQTITWVQSIAVWIIPVLFAITLHEAAHAWVANYCGDTTAKAQGRLSLNPLKHIDPIGTVVVPLFIAVMSGFQFVFGWAKPVPINWEKLHRPRWDVAMVAAAGPLANFFMSLLWAFCAKIGMLYDPTKSMTALFMLLTGMAGIQINLVLAFLNLIPIPPLDGGRVLSCLLPPKLASYYAKIEPFGFFIIILLLFTGLIGRFISPLLLGSIYLINSLFHIIN